MRTPIGEKKKQISDNAPRLSEVLKIQKLVLGFLKFSEAADTRCSAKLRSEASKFGGQWAPRRVQENCERASNFAERIGTCEVAPWIIDYFVNIALLDYITKLAISSAQFGLRKFCTP